MRYFNLINQRLEQCVHASTLHGWSLIECQITIWTWSWTGDVQIARTYILFSFTKERRELTIRTTKHGLLGSFTTRKVCFLTINYGQNEFAELQIGKFIFWPQIWGSSQPFDELHGRFFFFPQLIAICYRWATKHSFMMMQAVVTRCQTWRLAGQNTCKVIWLYQDSFIPEALFTYCHRARVQTIHAPSRQ